MATVKVFSLGGLDKKSNDLTRPTEKASDMVNMEYDTQSTIKKRNGFVEQVIDGASTADFTDIVYYNSKDEILGFKAGSSTLKVLRRSGGNFTTRSLTLPSTPSTALMSFCESQNNIYFTDSDYSTYVMKYDGSNVYRAGLPTPRNSATAGQDNYPSWASSTAGLYTRLFYSYKDINGNVIYSPYVQYGLGLGVGVSNLSISSFKTDSNCQENGFFDKYCYRDKSTTATINSGTLTLSTTKHNYIAGDLFLIDTENKAITLNSVGRSFIVLTVESVVSNTSITFTSASVGANTVSFAIMASYSSEYPIDVRCKVHYAISSSEFTGYSVQTHVLDNSVTVQTIATSGVTEAVLSTSRPNTDLKFENIYDSATSKIMPPICKYIASFGEQIVYGSIKSYFTSYDHYLNAPNQRVEFANTSLITYSDRSTGDGPENTSELNFTKIGETWDGEISGLRRCNDSMIIFKNKGVFSIDGDIIDGQFILRKISTNLVGCTSFKSILESEEGVYFQAHNGVYYTNAVKVVKLTYEIDSLFQSGDYLGTKSVRLKKKQKSIFYTPDIISGSSKIVVIDYYYNQIYMWNSATLPTSGIIEDKNGDVYFCSSLKLYKFNDGYTDNGTAVNASYSTTWHHAGEPALNKKWLSIRTWGLTDDAFTATIQTEGDWQAGTYLTSNDSVYSATTQTDFKMLDMQTKKALRIKFSNNINNENLVLTGYELTWEPYNAIDKN